MLVQQYSHMERGSSWALDDISAVADAVVSGESLYQVVLVHGEESLPSLESWDNETSVPGLQRTWTERHQNTDDMHAVAKMSDRSARSLVYCSARNTD